MFWGSFPSLTSRQNWKPESMVTTCLNLCWVSHPKHQIEVPFFLPAPQNVFLYQSPSTHSMPIVTIQYAQQWLNRRGADPLDRRLSPGRTHQSQSKIALLWVHLLWRQDRGPCRWMWATIPHVFVGLPRWFPGRSFLSILEEEDVQWPVFHQVAQPPMSYGWQGGECQPSSRKATTFYDRGFP